MTRRSDLRAEVWEMAGGRCEHPVAGGRCTQPGAELAHIHPRGMGHKGARDTLANVMCACTVHARSTDDLSSPEWDHVPDGDRIGLTGYVAWLRAVQGFDVDD